MAVQGPIASTNATSTTLIQHSQTARDACPSASAPVPTSTPPPPRLSHSLSSKLLALAP